MLEKPDPNKPVFKLFPGAIDQINKNLCPCCGREIGEFRDALSEKEYSISGMCQSCQDEVFG